MKICLVQSKSLRGAIDINIQNHLDDVDRAIALKADLIVFPELSVTSYEPSLAEELAFHFDDAIFDLFQELADQGDISIGIGLPIKENGAIYIGMLLFQPNTHRSVYYKQMLHDDELPYFSAGTQSMVLDIKGQKIGLGICYETLQRAHFIDAKAHGATIYIASVAKSQSGIEKAYAHFANMTSEFKTPILMCNSVGHCDDFLSAGQSAVWNKSGALLKQLDSKSSGLLIYDTTTETTMQNAAISKGQLADLDTLFQIYTRGRARLEQKGIFQWTDNYPTRSIIENDLNDGVLHVLKLADTIVGAINISEIQEAEYQSIDWQFEDTKVLVIHRLVIDPVFQRQGFATQLMDFAERFAKEKGYTSIRLDAYSQHSAVIDFYQKRNYYIRGAVRFPEREYAFHCMEMGVS